MKESLAPGVEGTEEWEVRSEHTTGQAGGSLFSTPSMIGIMEVVCMHAAEPHLDEGETSVGIHVCVSHEAPATVGETVTFSCRLAEIEGRKLLFDVEARVGERVLGRGTHRRAVVRFG